MSNDKVLEPQENKNLKEQVEDKKKIKLFGTFTGVFLPTLLTILGVIMFLRQGWVVGNAGLLGAWLIILLAFGITSCTALCLSSITTNIRIGAGGAFSVISQSLGLEMGGSIGIPLYLCQSLAIAMYIFGFRSGWQWIFPEHPALLIDISIFAILFIIAFISAGFAFKIQYFILGVIGISLLSIGIAAAQGSMQHPIQWWGEFPGSIENNFSGIGFWAIFAVFFPASTGIMAGANMSGELENPRENIPLGTMSAIGVSLIVYLAVAYWLARSATPTELVENYNVMIDKSAWGPAVLAGLLGATFSSALSSLVGAPRILQALGAHNILPKGEWFGKKTAKGEPRNALFFTGAITLGVLMLRDLNTIAPLITMFFLLTYTMINMVVFIEQNLKLISFRPTFRVPSVIPLLGMIGCIFAMFIINPVFSLIAISVVVAIHTVLIKRSLNAPFGDVRSGIFVAVAEWAVKKIGSLDVPMERVWKANLLFPLEKAGEADQYYDFVKDLCYPKGFLKIIGLTKDENEVMLTEEIKRFVDGMKSENIFTSWALITVAEFSKNLTAGIESFQGSFLKPNFLLLTMPDDKEREEKILNVINICKENKIGVLLIDEHKVRKMGKKNKINIWFDKGKHNWDIDVDLGEKDLAVLAAYKLKLNWDAELQFVAEIEGESEKEKSDEFLDLVIDFSRLPVKEKASILKSKKEKAPIADLNVMALPNDIDFKQLRNYTNILDSTCMFTLDSGEENALA